MHPYGKGALKRYRPNAASGTEEVDPGALPPLPDRPDKEALRRLTGKWLRSFLFRLDNAPLRFAVLQPRVETDWLV